MPSTPAAGVRRALVSLSALLAVALAGCAGPTTPGGTGPTQNQPASATEADWKPVADILGRTGKLSDNNTVYRISLPRGDLRVTTGNVAIKPGLALGGYAALATGLRAALDATAIPPAAAPPAQQPPIDLNTAGIDQALGRKGTAEGGIYKFTIARVETITDDGKVLPPGTGVTTGINFQPLGGGKAAINGDFVMTTPEVQKVIQALRRGGIDLVEIHNHTFTEQPRLFYAHFWAVGDGATLATALRPALDATNPQPAK